MVLSIEGPLFGAAASCEPILQALPDWFGIATAAKEYGRNINDLPTFLAKHDEQVVGFVAIKQQNPYTAELYVLGVRCELHRRGIGRRLLQAAEQWMAAIGLEYAYVKTIGPSRGSEPYERTRRFYLACGYRPLEESKSIWTDNPCLIMTKKLG